MLHFASVIDEILSFLISNLFRGMNHDELHYNDHGELSSHPFDIYENSIELPEKTKEKIIITLVVWYKFRFFEPYMYLTSTTHCKLSWFSLNGCAGSKMTFEEVK
jgi:hypothetical protein